MPRDYFGGGCPIQAETLDLLVLTILSARSNPRSHLNQISSHRDRPDEGSIFGGSRNARLNITDKKRSDCSHPIVLVRSPLLDRSRPISCVRIPLGSKSEKQPSTLVARNIFDREAGRY
ncbi:MAG: hypothetical protein AAGA60_15215 [Cyanobacteria bacterium P01_E01_bin.42]